MASVTASRTGLERISLEFGIRRQLHHLGIFGEKEKRSEKPETRYDLVCSYVRISGENKTSNNSKLSRLKTSVKIINY